MVDRPINIPLSTPRLTSAAEDRISIRNATGAETIEIRDRLGRIRAELDLESDSAVLFAPGCELRFEMADGKLELACSSGIRFATPGPIEFVSGQGVRIQSGDTACQITPSGVKLTGEELTLTAESMTVSGQALKARWARVTLTAGKLEQFADRVFQHARHSYQRIEMLLHTRAGRIRTEAEESHLMQAGSVRVVAEGDVRIQAETINLG